MPPTSGPCWFCNGEKIIAQYVYTFPCPKCGGTGLQVDATRREQEHREWERKRRIEHDEAVATLRALHEREVR
jgi:predicted RNA-binding Zn-ribbon protein involved in translation (DUF1610 family)